MENIEIEKMLHHRKPYLMLDKVIEISANQIHTTKTVSMDDYYASGHFPGATVVPGAVMHEICTQSAGVLIAKFYNPMEGDYNTEDPFHNKYALGVLKKMEGAKFLNFAKPGDELHIKVTLIEHLENLFKFKAEIQKKDSSELNKVMQCRFTLCNIESRLLYN
jgi:3-hydroxyacyl-[acyl-carrier-protein] dehydratase